MFIYFLQSYSTGDDEDMFRIKGGTKQILTALCSTFDSENQIKLGTVVKAITASKDGVRIDVKDKNGQIKACLQLKLH